MALKETVKCMKYVTFDDWASMTVSYFCEFYNEVAIFYSLVLVYVLFFRLYSVELMND
jgi:hypothetical protein